MPRKPEVRYFDSRKAYYTTWQGQQHKLAGGPNDAPTGETYLKALRNFQTLMQQGTLDTAGDSNTVRTIFNAYLAAKEGKCRDSTFAIKRAMLPLLVAKCGDLKVSQVKPYHARTILDEQKTWNNGTRWTFLKEVNSAFNWAVRQELIPRNPIRAVEMPSTKSKSRERIISAAEHDKVLASLTMKRQQSLRRIIVALENTGARPSELTSARVRDFNAKIGAVEYFADNVRAEDEHGHKTSGKGNHRVVYFTGDCLHMVKQLCEGKNPTDYIFTTNRGTPYVAKELTYSFGDIGDRLGIPHFCPYAYRHAFATRWLAQGKSIELLATLLGNSANIIRKNYSHLIHEHDTLRSQLEAFRQQEQREHPQPETERIVLPMRQAK